METSLFFFAIVAFMSSLKITAFVIVVLGSLFVVAGTYKENGKLKYVGQFEQLLIELTISFIPVFTLTFILTLTLMINAYDQSERSLAQNELECASIHGLRHCAQISQDVIEKSE